MAWKTGERPRPEALATVWGEKPEALETKGSPTVMNV
jgi:hypothetical protein